MRRFRLIPLVVPCGFVVRVTASMSITQHRLHPIPYVDVPVIPQCRISNHTPRESFHFPLNTKLSGTTANNYGEQPPRTRTEIRVIPKNGDPEEVERCVHGQQTKCLVFSNFVLSKRVTSYGETPFVFLGRLPVLCMGLALSLQAPAPFMGWDSVGRCLTTSSADLSRAPPRVSCPTRSYHSVRSVTAITGLRNKGV